MKLSLPTVLVLGGVFIGTALFLWYGVIMGELEFVSHALNIDHSPHLIRNTAVFLTLFGLLNLFSFATRASPVEAQAEYFRGIPIITSGVVVIHYLVEAFWFGAVDRLVAMLLVFLLTFGVAINRVDIDISNGKISFAWAKKQKKKE
mmetsp:Transcript_52676/g.132500  ORF Transcript_52676/g.132500 Transcript_52676/m.132500 type:complete len:147 (+) Transcript_52676:96-536(+)|eukprot:CAMPEP_0177641808 /NCGR_PEP_ID=MMETSP0447-20121125/7257_1 /TAXON_ID=0 /ORGANISM="Stygamoeba regulata, Strain BSH-02190019" /LENGTH=146 /DNA_ID=CAMNT_0019143937 /DNA_START=96 /DNA_END=536 /DNA_ORIENTATION=+